MQIRYKNTWRGSLNVLLAAYENSETSQGRSESRRHLGNMADMADLGANAIELIKEMRELGELSPEMKGKFDLFMTEIGHNHVARIPEESKEELRKHALEYFQSVPEFEDRIEATILEIKAQFNELREVSEGSIENEIFAAFQEEGVPGGGVPGFWEGLVRSKKALFAPCLPVASEVREFHLGFEIDEFVRAEALDDPEIHLCRNWFIEAHTQNGTMLIADFNGYAPAMSAARRFSGVTGISVCDTVKEDVIRCLNDVGIREVYGAWVAKHCDEGCDEPELTSMLLGRWEELREVPQTTITWIGEVAQTVRELGNEDGAASRPSCA